MSDFPGAPLDGIIYRLLTGQDQQRLRLERIALIEADLYRAQLQLEDALSSEEKAGVLADIRAFQTRLQPHYQALGMMVIDPVSRDDTSSISPRDGD